MSSVFEAGSADAFAPPALMPAGRWIRGRHAGLPIDPSERRPLVLLDAASAASYGGRAGELVAANFFHDGKFWIARFPAEPVEAVIFQKWDFGESRLRLGLGGRIFLDFELFHVAHTELRFRLKPGRGVILYSQERPSLPPAGAAPCPAGPPPRTPSGRESAAGEVGDLVCSIEAVGPAGTQFNLRGALANHFVAVRRFKSLRESFYERVIKERRVVEQWELALPGEKRQELLRRAIQSSHDEGLTRLYHMFLNSCTTAAFRLIDSVMDYGIRQWRTVFQRIPHFPEAYLWARRLLKPKGASRLPTLNAEKAAWKEDAGLKARFDAARESTREERAAARAARRERIAARRGV